MNHNIKSIRPFIGAKDFEVSRSFYRDLGFEEVVLESNFSVFKSGEMAFYLQDYYDKSWIENTMIFLEVDDADRDALINVFMGQPISLANLPVNMQSGNFLGFVEGWRFQASFNELAITLLVSPLPFSLQAMAWQDVSVAETFNTLSPTLDYADALVVN